MVSQKIRRAVTLVTVGGVAVFTTVWGLLAQTSETDLFSPPVDPEKIIKMSKEATFEIFCEGEDEYGSGGTGWHLKIGESNYVITNAHVIDACIGKNELYIYDHTKERHATEILGYRHTNDYRGSFDIAVLRGRPDIPTLELSKDEQQLQNRNLLIPLRSSIPEGLREVRATVSPSQLVTPLG